MCTLLEKPPGDSKTDCILLGLTWASAVTRAHRWVLLLPELTWNPPFSHRSLPWDSYELSLYIWRERLGQNLHKCNPVVLAYVDSQGVFISQIMTLFSFDLIQSCH